MSDIIIRVTPTSSTVNKIVVATGVEGKSAYEVAVENGYEGTEAQWIASLSASSAVAEYANLAAFPETGASGIIYVAKDTDLLYRWDTVTEDYVGVGGSGGGGAVDSVNGHTGVVVLTYSDVGAEPAKGTDDNYVTDAEKVVIGNTSGTNTGDEDATSIKSKLGISTLSGSNTGDEDATSIKSKLGISTLSGSNTGDQDLSGYQLKSADIDMAENTSIALDPVLSADGKYTGITRTGTAGAALAFGDLVHLSAADSRWELTDANSASGAVGDCRGAVGICVLAAAGDGSATKVLLSGVIRADAKFPTLTVNGPVFISETAGLITNTAPTTTDAVVKVVGFGLTADEMYFNPSSDWIVVQP